MKKLAIVFGAFALLLAIVYFVGGMLLAGEFSVTRSLEIDASPEEIYAFVGHLDRWPDWTPWNSTRYPELAYEYPGKTEGVGAVQLWTMDGGTGRLEVTSAEPARGVSYTLQFEGTSPSEGIISFEVTGERTTVKWLNRGTLDSTREKWFGLFLEGALGRMFEEGLESLQARCAATSPAVPIPAAAPGN